MGGRSWPRAVVAARDRRRDVRAVRAASGRRIKHATCVPPRWVVAIPDEGAERVVRHAVGEAAGGEPCREVVVARNARVEHVDPHAA